GKTITATRTGGTETGTSNTFDVNAGALAKFAISTISDPQTAGTAFGITITAQDANNNTVTGFTSTVNLSTTAGTISPAVSAVFASGVRTESVSVTQAGTGKTITATRTGGSETGTSNSFTVNPGAPAAVTLAGAATDLTSGSSRSYTATVKDANGNVATNFGGSVTFSQTTGSGSLTGLGSVNAVSGVATISLTGNAAGSVTIKAAASSIDSNTLTFNVIAGALNKFAIANISSPQTAGSAFGITITAQDAK